MSEDPREESFWAVVTHTLVEARRLTRIQVALLLASGAAAVGMQVWDVWGRLVSPLSMAELLSPVMGTFGAVLVGLASVLHGAAEKASGCSPRRGLDFEPRTLHRVLLAVPGFGVAAGGLLGAAAAC